MTVILPWSVLPLPSKTVALCLKALYFTQLVSESMPVFTLPSLLWQGTLLVNFWELIFFSLLVCVLHAFPAFTDIYKIFFWPPCFPA